MPPAPPDHDDPGWTSYSPSPPPPNAGVCSFCGERQAPDRLVLMSGDGTAGVCEHCAASHVRFFARRRSGRSGN
jgi:hypothetical protein